MVKWRYFLLLVFVISSCQKDDEVGPLYFPALLEIPKGFPAIVHPEGNEFSLDRWRLGKRLFFDVALSQDSSISCGSCHQPALSFTDGTQFSLGVGNALGIRNSPSLANVAYQPYLTREGGVPTLEMQVLIPIQEHNEFNFNIVLIAERLKQNESYVQMALDAYDRELDAFVITRAISCFERSLLSGNSPYDQYLNTGTSPDFSKREMRGMELFFSERTNCSKCHGDFNFTNYAFENNGLYEEYLDDGRFRLTSDESDRALFKVPSLRNIELTGPYMHDGSFNTLDEVIEHYRSGGEDHPHKSDLIKPLSISNSEKEDLIHFLNALTDRSFVGNPLFIH